MKVFVRIQTIVPAMVLLYRLVEIPCFGDDKFFRDRVAAILEQNCVRCHNADNRKGGLSLESAEAARKGGDSGPAFIAAKPDESLIVQQVIGEKPEMPKSARPLSKDHIAALNKWIADGAAWPNDVTLKDRQFEGQAWWSLQPLVRPKVPNVPGASPIDAFVISKLAENGLSPSPEADRRTLIRRLSFDLHGLPPDPADVDAFVADPNPMAYEALVDRLLKSPRYGERWARHWLDVVHYGDTHGYDKDKLRPNAWPYRDYVIRALNDDKTYDRFVLEQLAGDILWPNTLDGITATGFIAAGPWDFIGHAEVPESKIDGKIARNLDRDDMVTTAMNAFCSLTVQCARCHNHKFDPVTQTDYYRMQAIFAALDRADRMFDIDPDVGRRRAELLAEQKRLKSEEQRLSSEFLRSGGDELKGLDQRLAAAQQAAAGQRRPEYGYHSAIEASQDRTKWVQVDLGREVAISKVTYSACWDDFNQIGAGFGFPVRFKIEAANDSTFASGTKLILDQTTSDFANPGIALQQAEVNGVTARYVRMTATKLAPRQNDYIFALAELSVFDGDGKVVSQGATVTALDSIEAPIRWAKKNLVDGISAGQTADDVKHLREQRQQLVERLVPKPLRDELQRITEDTKVNAQQLSSLPAPQYVFAGMVHSGSGAFVGTGASGGKPRPIHILKRGDVTSPSEEVGPGIVPLRKGEPGEFMLGPNHSEGERRVAFAKWVVDEQHPLTWRSIVNRVWQHHFGRGLVDTPNDFGRMGQLPSHPELLDWLAVEFRDGGRSLKRLHRMIVTSATYRQRSEVDVEASRLANSVDSMNTLLWRANRRKLDAESLRDTMLYVAGKLDERMGGPAFQDFVIDKPEHSPHYEYQLHDPEDPKTHRRSIYRFLVRSQTQPFMTTLDCADPSMIVDKRGETVTALQALALLNNKLVLSMSGHMARRVSAASRDEREQVVMAFQLAIGRTPSTEESNALQNYARTHGLAQTCRVIFNLNEFAFVD